MKILVTGGTGFIGRNLVSELTKNNHEVTVFDNGFRSGFSQNEDSKNISLIKGDVTKIEDWEKIPKNIDMVYHLAAINGTKFFYEIPYEVAQVNIQGTLNFLNWVRKTDTQRFFFASSSEVYGFPKIFPTPESEPLVVPDPTNPRFSYSSSKIMGEILSINFAKKNKIDYTIGRFHNVYGPKMGFEHVIPEFIRKIVKKEIFDVQGDGSQTRSFCYVTDAINEMILVSENKKGINKIFNLGNDEEINIKKLIELLQHISGNEIKPQFHPFENAGTDRRVPNLSEIKKLGYEPKISIEEGLKKIFKWYSEYYLCN